MAKGLAVSFLILLLALAPGFSSGAASGSSEDYQKANRLFQSAHFREALALYQKVLADPPRGVLSADIQSHIGDSWFRLGSFGKALDAYRIAIRTQKESVRPETQYWIGFCCFLTGNDMEAVDEFLKIPAFYPDAAMWVSTAYYWAGRASERMGKGEEAALYYRKAGGKGKSPQEKFAIKKAERVKK